MGANSGIEWTHHTFNPWWGCTKVSEACVHCYAWIDAKRYGHEIWGPGAPRRFLSGHTWNQPLLWDRQAQAVGQRHRVFCASMADVFEDRRDLDEPRSRLWALIEATPNLDWLLLTKRPEHMRLMTPWPIRWPRNVWAMTTAESQRWLDERWAHLRGIPAEVLGLSMEPLLSEVDLTEVFVTRPVDSQLWVIAGGESSAKPRPTPADWFRSLRDQCVVNRIPFFFKQWGVQPKELSPTGKRLSKKQAGRLLDGQEWSQVPASSISA
ncbi:MAG: phage Gp37/Gp68 family protein [Nitrospira sp.]|nr:phage Gp37/Gp68 family protein [Nitrospira sp.]